MRVKDKPWSLSIWFETWLVDLARVEDVRDPSSADGAAFLWFSTACQNVPRHSNARTVVRVASSRENKGVLPDRSAPNAGPRADPERREAPRQIEPKLSDQRHLRRVFTDTQRLEQMVRINRTTDHIL